MLGAYFQMSQRGPVTFGPPQQPADWRIAFRIPTAWEDKGTILGQGTAQQEQMRAFMSPGGRRQLLIGRLFVDEGVTPEKLGRELIVADVFEEYRIPPSEIRTSTRRLEDWDAAEVDWQPHAGSLLAGMRVQVLAIVTPLGSAEKEAYFVELQSQGTRPSQDRELWARLTAGVEAVKP